MNNKLIDRGAVMFDYLVRLGRADSYKAKYEALAAAVDNAPTVDAEPVKHGRWVIKSELEENILEPREYDEHFYAVCSECGRTIYLNDYICITGDYEKAVKEYPYCHCGAKMEGVKE